MVNQYINDSVKTLVVSIQDIISRNKALKKNEDIKHALAIFDHTCRISPSTIHFIINKILQADGKLPFNLKQIQIIMAAVLARSSSSYGNIPSVVSHLSLVGAHAEAAILNENVLFGVGNRQSVPHSELLYESFRIIGEAFKVPWLTPASYHIFRLISLDGGVSAGLGTIADVRHFLESHAYYLPDFHDEDIEVALHYRKLAGSDIVNLHSFVVLHEAKMDDADVMVSARNPYKKNWLALRCLELAMREADSVDEFKTGRLSYIGCWGLFIEALMPWLPAIKHDRVRAWTQAHNDDLAGQATGRQGPADERHANDARFVALRMLNGLKPQTFAEVLNGVAELNQSRLAFWDIVAEKLKAHEPKASIKPLLNSTQG